MENSFDVIIIGGGISGLALANSLKNQNKKILLLERKVKYVDVNRGDTLYPHSLDALKRWGILDKLIERGAVKSDTISIYGNDRDLCDLKIISSSRTENNFLLSLNHELIEQSFYENLNDANNVKVVLGANVTSLTESNGQYSTLTYKHEGVDNTVTAKLFVACDGRDSILRKNASINYSINDFQHDIVILDSNAPINYPNHTWFVYGKNHPILVGPLPNGRVRLSVIVEREVSRKWMMMNEADLTTSLQAESDLFKNCTVTKSESHIYEIKMSLADVFYRNNLVLLGDSAHTVHPVSGQGMALAISDADYLRSIILKNEDINTVSKEYGDNRRKIVIDLLQHVSNLGNFMVSENKVIDMARMYLINDLETIPAFERQVEAMLQSEVEKF